MLTPSSGTLIFLPENMETNPGKFCACICHCFPSAGEQPLAPGPGSMDRMIPRAVLAADGGAKGSRDAGVCRTWIQPQSILFPCLLCSRSYGKGKPRLGERQEISYREGVVPWLTALITDADPAAPSKHSKSLNMFVPCLSLQTAPAGRTLPRFIPEAKEKQLQEGAGCVRQLKPWFLLQGTMSSAPHPGMLPRIWLHGCDPTLDKLPEPEPGCASSN